MLTSEKSVMLKGSVPLCTVSEAREIADVLKKYDYKPQAGDKYREVYGGREMIIADQDWMNNTWEIKSKAGGTKENSVWVFCEDKMFRMQISYIKSYWVKF